MNVSAILGIYLTPLIDKVVMVIKHKYDNIVHVHYFNYQWMSNVAHLVNTTVIVIMEVMFVIVN